MFVFFLWKRNNWTSLLCIIYTVYLSWDWHVVISWLYLHSNEAAGLYFHGQVFRQTRLHKNLADNMRSMTYLSGSAKLGSGYQPWLMTNHLQYNHTSIAVDNKWQWLIFKSRMRSVDQNYWTCMSLENTVLPLVCTRTELLSLLLFAMYILSHNFIL